MSEQQQTFLFHHDGRVFFVDADSDGFYWFVKVYERDSATPEGRRLRYEYKMNHPREYEAACRRGWDIFSQRHLQATKTPST